MADSKMQTMSYKDFVQSSEVNVYTVGNTCFLLRYPFSPGEISEIKRIMKYIPKDPCNTCFTRVLKYGSLYGPNGFVFGSHAIGYEILPMNCLGQSYDCSEYSEIVNFLASRNVSGITPELFIVRDGSFGKIEEGEYSGYVFLHPTVFPAKVSFPKSADKLENMIDVFQTMDIRLNRLFNEHGKKLNDMFDDVRKNLKRPDHWNSVLQWFHLGWKYLEDKFNGKFYNHLNDSEKMSFKIFLLTIGKSHGNIHLDFKQSSNFVDFLDYINDPEGMARFADKRSDPRTYQVAEVNRRLREECITSECTVTVTWSGPDDIDPRILTPNGYRVQWNYTYGDGCNFDFDTNGSGVHSTEAPAVNISCRLSQEGEKPFQIYVNNYRKRSGCDTPFTVIIQQVGKEPVIYEGVWPISKPAYRYRGHGDESQMLFICEHRFDPVVETKFVEPIKEHDRKLNISPNHLRRWNENFGTPRVTLATLSDIKSLEGSVVAQPNMAKIAERIEGEMDFSADRLVPSSEEGGKRLEMKDLIDHLENGSPVSVRIMGYAPGYITKIETPEKVTEKSGISFCHFNNKFELPVYPAEIGNGRFNEKWFTHNESLAKIKSIVFLFGKYFLVLENTVLPNDKDFPLAGGFYPTDLLPEYHEMRSYWTRCQTLCKVEDRLGELMIGSFVLNDSIRVIINGDEVDVHI